MIHTLGPFLRRRRKELGMTQEQLEETSGVSQNEISKLENDRVVYPTPEILAKLASALDLTMDDINRARGWTVQPREEVIPVYGRIPANSVRFTARDGASMSEIGVSPRRIEGARSPYGLEVSGDCFRSIGIYSGDVVIVEPAEGRDPKDGQIVVVRIDDEVTLKRWCQNENGIIELRDGDERTVERIDPQTARDIEVLAFYVTFEPLAPR